MRDHCCVFSRLIWTYIRRDRHFAIFSIGERFFITHRDAKFDSIGQSEEASLPFNSPFSTLFMPQEGAVDGHRCCDARQKTKGNERSTTFQISPLSFPSYITSELGGNGPEIAEIGCLASLSSIQRNRAQFKGELGGKEVGQECH